MQEFDEFWQQEKPENLLAYPSIREKFVKHFSTDSYVAHYVQVQQ